MICIMTSDPGSNDFMCITKNTNMEKSQCYTLFIIYVFQLSFHGVNKCFYDIVKAQINKTSTEPRYVCKFLEKVVKNFFTVNAIYHGGSKMPIMSKQCKPRNVPCNFYSCKSMLLQHQLCIFTSLKYLLYQGIPGFSVCSYEQATAWQNITRSENRYTLYNLQTVSPSIIIRKYLQFNSIGVSNIILRSNNYQ